MVRRELNVALDFGRKPKQQRCDGIAGGRGGAFLAGVVGSEEEGAAAGDIARVAIGESADCLNAELPGVARSGPTYRVFQLVIRHAELERRGAGGSQGSEAGGADGGKAGAAQAGNIESGRPIHPLRSEEHTSELQSLRHLVCRLLLEK